MPGGQIGSVLRQVHRLFGAGTVAGLTEDQLLERFVTRRDEAAFEALVARHGPMVLGVCRRLLDDPNDVDDAFQATFLVLVQKASSIRDRALLGHWLYGVAHKVAARSRAEGATRKARQRGGTEMVPGPGDGPAFDDLGPVLHEELGRLPEKYRAPVVLCYLEGRTHEEAARQLQWPVGTVKGRLARARDQLRERLARRGLALPAGLLAATLARDTRAAVPPALLEQTVRAAMGVAAGKAIAAGVGSATAIALAEGVIHTMFATKLKVLAAGLVTAGVVVSGAGAYAWQSGGGSAPQKGKAAQAKGAGANAKAETHPEIGVEAPQGPSDLERARTQLAKIEAEHARRVWNRAWDFVRRGITKGDEVRKAARDLLDAERRAAGTDQAGRIAAAEAHLARMKAFEQQPQANDSEDSRIQAALQRAEAELWLAEAKAGLDSSPTTSGQVAGMMMGMMPGGPGMGGAFGGGGEGIGPGGVGGAVAAGSGEMAGPGGLIGGLGGGVGPASGGAVMIDEDEEDQARNEAIRKALGKVVPMPFADETTLDDVLKYVQQATVGPELPNGIPIYLDPLSWQAGEPTQAEEATKKKSEPRPRPTIRINLEGVRLKTSLRLVLDQVGLDYTVNEGLLMISMPGSPLLPQTGAPMMGGMGAGGGGMGGMGPYDPRPHGRGGGGFR